MTTLPSLGFSPLNHVGGTKEKTKVRQEGICLDLIFVLTTGSHLGECKLPLLRTESNLGCVVLTPNTARMVGDRSTGYADLVFGGSQWQAQGSPQSPLCPVPGLTEKKKKIGNLECIASQKATSPLQASES